MVSEVTSQLNVVGLETLGSLEVKVTFQETLLVTLTE